MPLLQMIAIKWLQCVYIESSNGSTLMVIDYALLLTHMSVWMWMCVFLCVYKPVKITVCNRTEYVEQKDTT